MKVRDHVLEPVPTTTKFSDSRLPNGPRAYSLGSRPVSKISDCRPLHAVRPPSEAVAHVSEPRDKEDLASIAGDATTIPSQALNPDDTDFRVSVMADMRKRAQSLGSKTWLALRLTTNHWLVFLG